MDKNENGQQSNDKEVDFSHYFELGASETAANQKPEKIKGPSHTKAIVASIFSITALIAAGILSYITITNSNKSAASYEAPTGYNYVSPPGEPPRIEKVK